MKARATVLGFTLVACAAFVGFRLGRLSRNNAAGVGSSPAVEMKKRLDAEIVRANAADADTSELLKAVELYRPRETKKADAVPPSASPPDPRQLVIYDTTFQQNLAKSRAIDAKFRANASIEIKSLPGNQRFERLVDLAKQYAAKGDFPLALHTLEQARTEASPELATSDEIEQLHKSFLEQTTPTALTINSDGATFISISNYRTVGVVGGSITTLIPPGDYEVVGLRDGYEEVRIPLRIRAGHSELPNIVVSCSVPLKK